MGLRRLRVTVVLWLCASSAVLVFGAAPASALMTRVPVFESASFSQPFAFGYVTGIAVDQATGNAYVADSATGVVHIYGAGGGSPADSVPSQITGFAEAGELQVAVDSACYEHKPRLTGAECTGFDPSNGDVYVSERSSHAVVKLVLNKLSGEYEVSQTLSITGEPAGVTVDGNGDLYVAVYGEQPILQFDSAGVEMGTIVQPYVGGPSSIAAGEPGVLYVGGARVKFNSKDELEEESFLPGEGGANGNAPVAVDSAGNVYVDNGSYVAEYSSTSALVEEFGQQELTNSGATAIAVNDEAGEPYVANTSEGDLVVFAGAPVVIPEATTGSVTTGSPSSVTVTGSVNPSGVALSECRVEYGTSTSYGQSAPCAEAPSSIPADSNFHAVSAVISGLTLGTMYHYRLVAGNANGQYHGADRAFTPQSPVLYYESISDLGSTVGMLSAAIDAGGEGQPYDTSYRFEYGTTASYGTDVPVPDGEFGSGESATTVSQTLDGLKPDTTYHFRVVATNSFGTTDGPDETFTTFQAQAPGVLPDGRVYEEVTPANKGGSADEFLSEGGNQEKDYDFGNASESGNEFLFYTEATFGGNPGSSYYKSYLFSRGQSGWNDTSLAAPGYGTQTVTPRAFDADNFSQVGLEDRSGSQAGSETDYVFAGPAGGPYATAIEGVVNHETFSSPASLVGGGGGPQGLNKLILASSFYDLAPGAEEQEAGEVLYEWTATGGLKVVNDNTNGSLISKCGAMLGNGQGDIAGGARGAVADEGAKVFFTAPDAFTYPQLPNCWNWREPNGDEPPQLYMREDGTRTVEVSAPNKGVVDSTGAHPAEYVGASADGSKVFFMSQAQLTADDSEHYPELYEYNTLTSTLTRISRGDTGNAAGDVWNVPEISGEGSEVYFQAFGKLAPGAPEEIGTGEGVNLYRYDTNTETTTYVTTLSPGDYYFGYSGGEWAGFGSGTEQGLDVVANWAISRDGQYLVFPRMISNYAAVLYRYDAADASIVCVSCNPTGVSTASNATAYGARMANSGNLNAGESSLAPRAISENGKYVFFTTAEALVPADTNGVGDVYEWHEGTISLLSSGTDTSPSFLLDASADGSNVFIGTHAKLVAADTDGSGDVYDARIDGGFVGAPAETSQCEGDACAGTYVVPSFATPSSSTFSGPGNVPAASQETKSPGQPRTKTKKPKHKKNTKRKKKAQKARKDAKRARRSARAVKGEGRNGQ